MELVTLFSFTVLVHFFNYESMEETFVEIFADCTKAELLSFAKILEDITAGYRLQIKTILHRFRNLLYLLYPHLKVKVLHLVSSSKDASLSILL
jgi:hypothetical protein